MSRPGAIRISAGALKGRRLATPEGIRPSGARLREALLSIWGERLAGARFLDLYAGSGAVGLEALSRGAAAAAFVERDPASLHALRANLRLAPPGTARLLARPAAEALRELAREGASFDLVFADPPYDATPEADLGALVGAVTAPGGAWAFELRARDRPPPPGAGWRLASSRRYGDSALALYEPEGA